MRAGRIGEESLSLLMEMHIAKQEWMSSHGEKALKRFERALATVESLGDPVLIATTMDLKNYFLFWQGRFRDVIETYERSLPDVERYPSGAFPVTAAITVARSYAMTGQLTQGLGMLHTIYDRCIERGDLYLASHAGSAIAMLMLIINRIDDAFRYFKSSLKHARQSQNHYVTLVVTFMLALAHHRKGENRESLRYLRHFLKDLHESHVSAQLYPYLVEICWAMEMGTFPRVPGLSLEHEIQEMLGIRNVLIRGIAYRYQALLGKTKGWSNQRIVRSLNLSARLIEDSGHQIEYAKTQLELARYHLSMGDTKKVRRLMRTASEILTPSNVELIPDDLRTFVFTPNREGVSAQRDTQSEDGNGGRRPGEESTPSADCRHDQSAHRGGKRSDTPGRRGNRVARPDLEIVEESYHRAGVPSQLRFFPKDNRGSGPIRQRSRFRDRITGRDRFAPRRDHSLRHMRPHLS